jgi:hypothetical protein
VFFFIFPRYSMRFPLAISAAALVGVAIAACSGGQTSNYIAPPPATVATSGPVTLAQTASAQTLAGSNNVTTGVLTFGSGTGTVTSTSSATAPSGTTAVTPAGRIRIQAATPSPTSPNVFYVTITSAAGATLSGLPQVSLALNTAVIGIYQEAQYTGGVWANVSGSSSTLNSAGTSVVFAMGGTPITIPAGGSIYLAFYQGNYPNPTPTPLASPTNIIADSSFESPVPIATYAGIATTATGGWQQCTINYQSPTKPNRALSKYAPPSPPATPGAVVEPVGYAVPQGTGTPAPTQKSVIANTGKNALLLGGVFNGDGTTANKYNLEDFAYNGVCQKITMPVNPTMSMALLEQGNQTASYFDFEVDLLDSNNNFVANLYEDPTKITATSSGDSNGYRVVTVPQTALTPYVGQSYTLFAGVWISGSSASYTGYYFLDDLQLVGSP